MLCRLPARACPHAEADIAEAAGGVGTHPGRRGAAWGHTLMEPSRAAWGHTLLRERIARGVSPQNSWTAYSKSASSRLISSIALSRLHLPPDLYKCGGTPFAFIDNAMCRKPAMLLRSIYRLQVVRACRFNSHSL